MNSTLRPYLHYADDYKYFPELIKLHCSLKSHLYCEHSRGLKASATSVSGLCRITSHVIIRLIVHARPNITFRFAWKAKVGKMATGGNVPELGGYDYEFTSKVAEDWQCPVCCLPLKDPVQIVGCGHRLCNICMESLLR